MEVKGSEAQGRDREGSSEGSVEQTCEPMNKNRIGGGPRWASGLMPAKPISIKDAGRKSGGCAGTGVELTSGDLRRVRERTEGPARGPDRGAEVSRGQSRCGQSVHSIGTLAGNGRNGRARRTGNATDEGPNGTPLRQGVKRRGE